MMQFIKYQVNKILSEFYKMKYISKNVRFLRNVYLSKNSYLEGYNSIGINNVLNNAYIGIGSYTGSNVMFTSVRVGKFCSIASNVKNVVGKHPTKVFVSTHPAFYSISKAAGFTFASEQLFEETKKLSSGYSVEIENDVWIGENVTILDGVRIGTGSIIGANSLVTKDILPYSINIGTPTQITGYRFSEQQIKFLLQDKWWDKDFEWIKLNYPFFLDIETYLKVLSHAK